MKKRKKIEKEEGSMIFEASASSNSTSTRRNRAGTIERTDKYKNIDDGLVPFKFSAGYSGSNATLDVRDAVKLCQKAYYNFSIFRNVIDLMTEFSISNIYFSGGNKKAKDFFSALFNKINVWNFQDKFFREYYRSGNVFVYRFDAQIKAEDVVKITQVYGQEKPTLLSKINIPSRYIILNPADIRVLGALSFVEGKYQKVISDYELQRLKDPKTEEDLEIYNSLDEDTKKKIKDGKSGIVFLPLDTSKVVAVFYKKQDYEPFAVPMGYPVLEDINFKAELKKMDMAISRTMQQAILLITTGAPPSEGGINQKNLVALQSLFENESVGRVLIADYTTKAEFVVPRIADLLDAKKYEIFDKDINIGLNNILVGGEKFANQSTKVDVFLARLEQGRQAFLNDFLIPEVKRIAKDLGFKSYPTPYFEEISLKDNAIKDRIYTRLLELGVLTPQETFEAMETGKLPDEESSIMNQKEFQTLKNDGLYSPLIGGQKEQAAPDGRPSGTKGIPQETKKISPIGASTENISLSKIKENMVLASQLQGKVEEALKKHHKLKKLNQAQKDVAEKISEVIISNEEPSDWVDKIQEYCEKPIDKNLERVKKVLELADKHQINTYLASLLLASVNSK